jgi:hypothetical protein
VFVHLGGEVVVDVREVVAVLDARHLQRTSEARSLLARAVAGGPQDEAPRAVVVTVRGVHAAPVSAATVARRIETLLKSRYPETAERQTGRRF